MRVRIRGPAGQAAILLSDTATIEDLKSQISQKTSVSKFDLKYGYPPRPLSLSDYAETAKLSDIGIKLDGEQLIVSDTTPSASKPSPPSLFTVGRPKPLDPSPSQMLTHGAKKPSSAVSPSSFSFADVGTAPPSSTQKTDKPLSLTRNPTSASLDAPELPLPSHASTLVLRIMPDDNSCLFRAFDTAFFGAMDNMTELRSIVAQNIYANPDTYSAVVLDQQPDDYCRRIQNEDAWGGAIELDILSKHFDVEISSIDVQTLRTDRFNEGRPKRCILVYSGIHYDAIALSPSDAPHKIAYAPPEFDTKIFDTQDVAVLEGAVELCRVLQGRHYYTDTAAFKTRCNICGKVSVGEKGATQHAATTGHHDFGEAA
ncbi:MAG: ubiquitin-specific protease otu1 [Alectoria sarmentosa]|nr:MAG: ubiquitin-specific protease otu1 [Alectoria sarmentosa]